MAIDFINRTNYFFNQTPAKVPGERVIRVAHEKWGPSYEVFRPKSITIGLTFIIKGQCTFKTKNDTWLLKKNMIAAFGPGPAYSLNCDPKDPAEIMIITFCGRDQISLAEKCLGGTCLAITPNNPQEISTIYLRMLENAKERRPFAEEICNSFITTLLWTINRGLLETNHHFSPMQKKYNECKQFIDKNFLKIKSVSQVASENYISHTHLCRMFQQFAHLSPNCYLLNLKINHASNLLQYTDEPIKTIASEMGFSDQYVFSKTFKRITNIAPQYFRDSY